MNTESLLLTKHINPSQSILNITADEALGAIQEMLSEFSIDIDFSKLSKEELEKLLFDYANAVVTYHPDDYHQERVVILKNEMFLNKYGLTDDDVQRLDFT